MNINIVTVCGRLINHTKTSSTTKIIEDNNYTIPKINEIIKKKTESMTYFTILDLEDEFFQVKIKGKDKYRTAFHFRNNLYQYTRMPQGFKNSPAIFQIIMDKIFKDTMEKMHGSIWMTSLYMEKKQNLNMATTAMKY
ncbi:Polyprotein P3 [Nosema granulosis]|uniref:Polyprotein P3 n=1 Tax=Nosema granulosis TaxID=83296 RepID=A0A9P6H197_9MICR|nr:Polyprotein P3 [Nosema granulosis]